jgi:hypothetical protein
MPDNEVSPNGPVNEKHIAAYLELYKQQMERFHQTQEIEWKANFGLWTLLAGAVYLTKDRCLHLSSCIAWPALAIVAALHGWWLSKIHKSEEADKELWCQYRREALTLLRGTNTSSPHETYRHRTSEGKIAWLLLEVSVTVLLATLVAFLATRN